MVVPVLLDHDSVSTGTRTEKAQWTRNPKKGG